MPRRRAFTLIELLVVIAIIGLLLSLTTPTMVRMVGTTNEVVCRSNMAQIGHAWVQYAVDNNRLLCGGWTRDNWDWICTDAAARGGHDKNSRYAVEAGALWKYVQELGAYHCPSDTTDHFWTYAISAVMNGEATRFTRLTQIIDPPATMVLMEEDDHRGYNMNSWMTHFEGDQWIDYVVGWHDGGANLAFADGHSETWKWEDPRSYTWQQFGKTQPGNDLKRLQSVYYPQWARDD